LLLAVDAVDTSHYNIVTASGEFRRLIQVFTDPGLFGDKLLEEASNMAIDEPKVKQSELRLGSADQQAVPIISKKPL